MLRQLAVVVAWVACVAVASKASADTPFDPTIDECAAPDAGCQPEVELDDATLEQQELAAPEDVDPVVWDLAPAVTCPDGTAPSPSGACVATVALATPADAGGCNTGHAGLIVIVAIAGLFVIARKRRLALALAVAACVDGGYDWDAAVDDGALAGDHVDVFAADVGDGTQYLLAHQPLRAGAAQPVAAFALAKTPDAIAIGRVAGACGDELAAAGAAGSEVLGYARAAAGAGTAELVELAAPESGCHVYETDPDEIDGLVAAGYAVTGSLGYVWPPGMEDAPVDDSDPPVSGVAPAPPPPLCDVKKSSPVVLLYASPGADESLRFLLGCPGEVIVGEKREDGPVGSMRSVAAQAQGGRTAFVLDRNGDKLRELLNRSNGVERTAAYLRHKLALGYDYLVIDEITAASDFADGTTLNHRLRQLLLRMPARTLLPYISIDLTQEPIGATAMRGRRLLLRAFKKRARALALEVYLHTAQVMAGAAPSTFRRAVDRVVLAIHGLAGAGGISAREIITIGTSMHSSFPQYRYLDQPRHDLESVTRQVNAIRHGSKRLRAERGVGYYFVNKSDMAPPSAYSYDALIKRLRTQALRFK